MLAGYTTFRSVSEMSETTCGGRSPIFAFEIPT
jgi:hypothetical protein